MLDGNSQHHKYAMVQFHFDGPKVEIKVKPHGNSKSAAPFFRTSNTTRKRITTVAFMYNPKQAVNIITLEQGGELEVKVLDVSLVIVDK